MSSMYELPKDPRKIRQRIRRYERKLRLEKSEFGWYSDGAGKRYFLGPLYLLMGDLTGAMESFDWFQREFPDDSGGPGHRLCWALALHRSGRTEAAERKLREAMLLNLYILPRLLGSTREEMDIWHSSNWEWPSYVDVIPPEYFSLWDDEALAWATALYHSEEFRDVEARYIEIYWELKSLPVGDRRTQLVDEAERLKGHRGPL